MPLELFPFGILENVLWHEYSACTVKSTHFKVFDLKVFVQAICRLITDILNMCMRKHDAEKFIFFQNDSFFLT